MKKIAVALLLLVGFITPTHAAPLPAIAVIDSGQPTALFQNIVTEVCIVESYACPNGKMFMEGPGASNIAPFTNAALTHGTEMLDIVRKVNPSAGLIPIRIVGITPAGNPSLYSNTAVKMALDWVVTNRVKYNISAVMVAQGKIFSGCAVPAGTAEAVASLKANNVPVIAAAGNDSNRTAMFSIACLPDVISIGATDNPDPGVSGKAYCDTCAPYIARYSNGTALTSFYLNARWYVLQPNGKTKFMVGTSNATAAMAGWWVLNQKATYADTYAFMISTSKPASNEWLSGKYVPIS